MFFAAYLNKNNNEIRPNKWVLLFIVLFFALLCVGNVGAADTNYTTDEDFSRGAFNNLKGSDDKLQLPESSNAHNYIWVPNSNEGTISKINVKSGQEVARYRTSPLNNANPSRTVVDAHGNCWVANYQVGSIVKIGSLGSGIDRNKNGVIDTSSDLDNNGVITGSELLAWGNDECVLYETVFIPGREGNYTPGNYGGGYANNWANPGVLAIVMDSKENIWVGCYGLQKFFQLNGTTGQILGTIDVSSAGHTPYGAIIDNNDVIWSAAGPNRNIIRLDTNSGSFTRINVPHWAYGLALDDNGHIFVTGYEHSSLSRINTTSVVVEWTKSAPYGSRGVIVTDDGDVWTANLESHSVTRFSNDGVVKATIYPGYGPSGLSIDADGKIWAVDYNDEYIHRIDPAINGVDLSKRIVSASHVGYNQMTTSSRNGIQQSGSWRIIHDSGILNTSWSNVTWNGYEPSGTRISMHVRSSNDQINWSNWEDAGNGLALKMTPPGQYLEVEAVLEIIKGLNSPVIYDICIHSLNATSEATDLAVNITGNASSLNIGDTVHLSISLSNLGPNPTDAKLNYKIPVGLKLLSSQGPGAYDTVTGVWNVGLLLVNSTVSLDLVLQATNIGYFVNVVTVYADLTSTHTSVFKPIFKVFNGKWKSTAAMGDSNGGNNMASYSFEAKNFDGPGSNSFDYKWPDLPPAPEPQPVPKPPTPKPPGPQPKPKDPSKPTASNDQLPRDIASVRGVVGGTEEAKIADWTLDPFNDEANSEKEYQDWLKSMLKFSVEVAILAFIEFTPTGGSATGEYLQGIKSTFLNNFKALNTIYSYFNKMMRTKEISNAFTKAQKVINNPTISNALKYWDDYLNKVGFNYGMSVFQKGLYKLFPGQEAKIDVLLLTYSTWQFINDPEGTINAIIDIISSLMKAELPERESFEKVFIFDPAQDNF